MLPTYYNFSPEKDLSLKILRNISFLDAIVALNAGNLLDIIEHPSKTKYSGQKIYVVKMKEYVYAVPFIVESPDSVFLKTIFPSRKLAKQYLG